MAKKSIDMTGEVLRGDPALHIVGQEEKPARKHAPLPPRPTPLNIETIIFDVELRMDEIRPLVDEYNELESVLKKLRQIKRRKG